MSNIKINVRKENGQYKTESTCVEVSGVNGSENTIAKGSVVKWAFCNRPRS